jgi:hypothetical protein
LNSANKHITFVQTKNKNYMKIKFAIIISMFAILNWSCGSSTDSSATPTGNFTATINGASYSDNAAYIGPSAGGTIAVFSTDSKGNSFIISIFEKDFPVNKATSINFSPSVSYTNAAKETYIPKTGTLTITSYEKSSAGVVNKMSGTFEMVGVGGKAEVNITAGKFNVSRK